MVKKLLFIFSVALLLSGCNYFVIEKKDKTVLVKQEIETLKARGLDIYPLIDDCNSEEKEDSKKCFETQLLAHINNYFNEEEPLTGESKTDTLWMKIEVSKTGELSLKSKIDTTRFSNFEAIKTKLEAALFDISPIKPAILRNQPVNCQFKLPIVITNTEL